MESIFNTNAPLAWYIAGPAIGLILLYLRWLGGKFGVSSTLRTACAIGGGGKVSDFFRFNWKSQMWNVIFAGGIIAGGLLAEFSTTEGHIPQISNNTVEDLEKLGLSENPSGLLPGRIFSLSGLLSTGGLIIILGGGIMVGFGARYAGGCTSGHAISGLSEFQLPSLIAVVGFFTGGLIATHLLLPEILEYL